MEENIIDEISTIEESKGYETLIEFDDFNQMLVNHSLTIGDLIISTLLVVLIALIAVKWAHETIFRRKEK